MSIEEIIKGIDDELLKTKKMIKVADNLIKKTKRLINDKKK